MLPPSEPNSSEKRTAVAVVKVGGSLLDRPELGRLLSGWLDRQTLDHIVMIAGGGELVAAIRMTDAHQQIDQSTSHWLAIEAMQETAQQLSKMIPNARLIKTLDELHRRLETPGITILDIQQFMREEEPHLPGLKLPAHWDVTSDSIAARVAIILGAQEFVLLKSCSPQTACSSLNAFAESGYVDKFLPQLQSELPNVRVVDLPGGREVCLKN